MPLPSEPLNKTKITKHLSDLSKEHLSNLIILSEVDSTNLYLQGKIQNNAVMMPVACLAESQTAGRGRRGRSWFSGSGENIIFSLAWRFERNISELSGLSLVVGIAVVRALENLGVTSVKLKWPNDIVYEHKKLGGILVETSSESSGSCSAIIGVGLNLQPIEEAKNNINQPITDILSILKSPLSRNQVATEVINELIKILLEFAQSGFVHMQPIWQSLDSTYGLQVCVSASDQTIIGIAMGIDESAGLLVRTREKIITFHGGEVSVRVVNEAID